MRTSPALALALLALALPGRTEPPAEADRLLAQARALDDRAEALLDKGDRPGAFEALARAADLRERARRLRAGEEGGPGADPGADARSALDAMDAALAKDDLKSAAAEGRRAYEAMERWAARLEAGPEGGIARRLADLEGQVEALRTALDAR